MQNNDGEITITIKAYSIPELIEKLQKVLGQYKPIQNQPVEQSPDFPEDIKQLYPRYDDHPHSAAMLTLLHKNHKGKAKAAKSKELAAEMIAEFPNLFKGKTDGEVSLGNIFSGTFLKKKGLINIEIREEEGWEYRVYWVD